MKLALRNSWETGWRVPDRRPIFEWATGGKLMLPPAFTKSGPFSVESSRQFIFPFDCLQNDFVREVNILAPVRSGKTLIADIWLPWTLENDPGPFRWVSQTDRLAKEHAEIRTWPILESVEAILALMPGGDRRRTQEVIFRNGVPLYIQGPALNTLQSKGFRYVAGDECYLYKQGIIGEIKGRVGDFLKMHTSKILFISQGGDPDGDWAQQFDSGKVFEWQIQCQKCDKFMIPEWNASRPDGTFWGMTWDKCKLPNGDWDIAKAVPSARWECVCGHPHIDSTRLKAEWNRTGRYPKADVLPTNVSIHWNGLVDNPWLKLVELWLHACNALARGNPTLKIQFYQKYLAMNANEQMAIQQKMAFARVVYEILGGWPEEAGRIMTVDCQEQDTFWVTIRAWSKTGRSRRLLFRKAFGFAELEKLREEYKVEPARVLIDCAFNAKGAQGVYAACVRYNWTAVRGEDREYFIHQEKGTTVTRSYAKPTGGDPESGEAGQGRVMACVIAFSKPTMNGRVQGLIDSGLWEEPTDGDPDVEREYAIQMASRVRKVKRDPKTGRQTAFWFEGKRDHARDCANMQVLGATLLEFLADTLDTVTAIAA